MNEPNPNLPTKAELFVMALQGNHLTEILMWAIKEIPEKIKRSGDTFYLIDFPRDSWSFMHTGPGYFANHVNSHNGIWIHFQTDGLSPIDDFVNLKELQQWREHNPRQPEAADDH